MATAKKTGRTRLVTDNAKLKQSTNAAKPPVEASTVAKEQASDDLVVVIVPKDFVLTLDDYSTVRFTKGVQKVKREHAEHDYAKAHGVTVEKV